MKPLSKGLDSAVHLSSGLAYWVTCASVLADEATLNFKGQVFSCRPSPYLWVHVHVTDSRDLRCYVLYLVLPQVRRISLYGIFPVGWNRYVRCGPTEHHAPLP